MVKRVLGGVAGGIGVFFWGFVSHVKVPRGEMGIRQIPTEEVVLGAFRDSIREPGLYFFPGRDMSKPPSESEQQALYDKMKKGPAGILVIQPEGREAMSPRQLGTEFATNVV